MAITPATPDDVETPDSASAPGSTATPKTERLDARTQVTASDDDAPDETPTIAIPTTPIQAMVADKDIPGELMVGVQKSLQQIQSWSAGIRATQKRAQAVLKDLLNNEEEAIKAHGEDGINPALDAAKLSQVFTPEQVKVILDKRKAFSNFYHAQSNWTPETSYSQRMDDIENNANPSHVPADSPAFATHVDMYNDLIKKALAADKERERHYKIVAEQTAKDAEQRMLPDGIRPDGIPVMNDAWLKDNQIHMKPEDVRKAAEFLRGGASYSDRKTYEALLSDSLYMTPDQMNEKALAAHLSRLLTTTDMSHVLSQNKEAQNDEGVKFIRDAMDTRLFGNDHIMQNGLNSLRQKVIQMYLAEKSSHPEWDGSQRMNKAMQLERENQVFDVDTFQQSTPMTSYIIQSGAKDRSQVTRATIDNATRMVDADIQAGKLTPQQRVSEKNSLESWNQYLNYVENTNRVIEENKRKRNQK